MYTRRNIRWGIILRFAWWPLIVFFTWSTVATGIFIWLERQGFNGSLPLAPLGTIGVAVALYVGFKNNQSYDRYWEGRKIWGGIVNVSRAWANQVLTYVSDAHAEGAVDPKAVQAVRQDLIYRHLAWINALRFQLRRKTQWGFQPKGLHKSLVQPTDVESLRKQIAEWVPASELSVACSMANFATQVLRNQSEQLRKIIDGPPRLIEEFRLISLMDLITEMYSLQGQCERIKNTPFPRQYAYFSSVFVWIFVVLLPFGIVGELAGARAIDDLVNRTAFGRYFLDLLHNGDGRRHQRRSL